MGLRHTFCRTWIGYSTLVFYLLMVGASPPVPYTFPEDYLQEPNAQFLILPFVQQLSSSPPSWLHTKLLNSCLNGPSSALPPLVTSLPKTIETNSSDNSSGKLKQSECLRFNWGEPEFPGSVRYGSICGWIYRVELNCEIPYRARNKPQSIEYLSDFPILDLKYLRQRQSSAVYISKSIKMELWQIFVSDD